MTWFKRDAKRLGGLLLLCGVAVNAVAAVDLLDESKFLKKSDWPYYASRYSDFESYAGICREQQRISGERGPGPRYDGGDSKLKLGVLWKMRKNLSSV